MTRPRPSRRAQIYARDNGLCVYCGDIADTVDHLIPQSHGGSSQWKNLVAACSACNNRRGAGHIPPLCVGASKGAMKAVRNARKWWRRFDSGLLAAEKEAAKIIGKQWRNDPACPFND